MNFRRLLLHPVLLIASAPLALAGPKSVRKTADVSITGIRLNDAKSSRVVLGREISSGTDPALIEDNTEMPHATATNKTGTEVLTFFFHPGGEVMAFSEFKVSLVSEAKLTGKPIKLARIASFVSGKGIKLGLSKAQLIKILGPPQQSSSAGGATILDYRIQDPEAGQLLGYPAELYYGTYAFKAGKLAEFRFGFRYP